MNIYSIRFKIIFNMLISLLIAVILVGGISIHQSRGIIGTYAVEKLDLLVRSYASKIDAVSGASEQTDINQKIAEEKMYKTGYLSLVDEKLNFVVHPDFTDQDNLTQVEDGKLQFLVEDIKTNKNNTVTYDYKGQTTIVAYYALDNGYIVMGNVLEKEIFEDLDQMITMGILTILIVLVLSAVAAVLLGNRITRPLRKLTEYLKLTAQFDLVERSDKDIGTLLKRKDEIGTMTVAVTDMRQRLKEMAKDIKDDASILTDQTDNVSAIMEESSLGIENVAEAINDLAEGALQLAGITQQGATNLHSLAEYIDRAVTQSDDINLYIEKITQSSHYGLEAINHLHQSVTQTSQGSNEVLNKVSLLEQKSEAVSQIVNTISGIAKQTNLLALNASIEAARAGEQGKGFSIVAEEIRKLAENVSGNAEEIDSTIHEILKEIAATKDEVKASNKTVEATMEAKENTQKQFKDIEGAIEQMVLKVKTLTQNIRGIDDNKNIVLTSMEKISSISQESSASTEEVSASTQQQFTHIQKVNSAAKELSQIARDLEELISLFKITH